MNSKENVTIALIDRHKLFCEGMERIIESISFLKVIAHGKNMKDALKVTKKYRPNLLVIDVHLIELGCINEFKKKLINSPDTRIILLSEDDYSTDYMVEALIQGVQGFLLRTMQGEELIDAMLSVFRGRFWLHPNVSHCLATEYKKLRKKWLNVELDKDNN